MYIPDVHQDHNLDYAAPAYGTLSRLRGGLTGVTRAPLQSHDLVLNVRIAIFEYICLLKSGDFGNFRKLENFEWEEIKIFILEVTNYNSVYLIVLIICKRISEIRFF